MCTAKPRAEFCEANPVIRAQEPLNRFLWQAAGSDGFRKLNGVLDGFNIGIDAAKHRPDKRRHVSGGLNGANGAAALSDRCQNSRDIT